MAVGKKATRFETVVLDDGVHEILLRLASDPTSTAMVPFVEAITTDAIGPMTRLVTAAGGLGAKTEDSHVWCSLVTEACHAVVTRGSPGAPLPRYGGVGYPRLRHLKTAKTSPVVRGRGLNLLTGAITLHSPSLPASTIVRALRLVAITSCTDVSRHPAVVRFAMWGLLPPTTPARYLTMTNYANHLSDVRGRWAARGNW